MHKIVPARLLNRFGNRLPYKWDTYAPGAFFVDPPRAYPAAPSVYSIPTPSLSKLVLVRSCYVTGRVVGLEGYTENPPWGHQTFYLAVPLTILNQYNATMGQSWPRMTGTLKVELLPAMELLPNVGDTVTVRGAMCIDLASGYVCMASRNLWSLVR